VKEGTGPRDLAEEKAEAKARLARNAERIRSWREGDTIPLPELVRRLEDCWARSELGPKRAFKSRPLTVKDQFDEEKIWRQKNADLYKYGASCLKKQGIKA